MSLLILADTKTSSLGVVEYFREPIFSNQHPCGPLLEMTIEEFLVRGFDLTLGHFEDYDRTHVTKNDLRPLFSENQEKAYLKRHKTPIMISKNFVTGEITVSPLFFRQYALSGLRSHDTDRRATLRPGFSSKDFRAAVEHALNEAG